MNHKDLKNILILATAAFSVIAMGIATYVFMAHVGKRYTESIVTYPKNGTEKSVFASNGKDSYLCCSEGERFEVYYTDKDSFTKLPYECPENKRIIRMAVDDEGNCSMLIYSAESEMVDGALLSTLTGETTEIDVIDKKGEILSRTDVSAYLTNENVPNSFETHDSIYYAMDCAGKAVVGSVLDGMDNVMSYDVDGVVTAVDDSNDEIVSVVLEDDISFLKAIDGSGKELWKEELPKSACKYGICAQAEDKIYLYNKELGVYAYDMNKKKIISIYKSPEVALGAGINDDNICILYEDEDDYELHFIEPDKL
ncbi:hypothetical protein D6853_00050 [Butyrivibrio sp. X503]|uniref:hypothetical protein n=1 Tax=Butyrivibrio sp. X503 TaxID=2364878 RepID=UPI000EAA2A1F|nr:hypothetical protein [Butyrivibrio sp. X503]RKM57972.1 hypothetical protein D6853_00050 [Butyrivibrio sp. X503]